MAPDVTTRRRFLGLTALVGLSGCVGGPAGGVETAAPTTSPSTGTATATASATPAPTGTPPLDLREANVIAVEYGASDGGYEFSVTLYHDDDGEDGYANWWQVECLDGERLGRRELLHAHGTREFTRSATVGVPEGTTCVAVRGHDRTHGYGGRVALLNLDSGAVRFVRQGPEPRSFAASDCP